MKLDEKDIANFSGFGWIDPSGNIYDCERSYKHFEN
jgi:hypothetical protein